MQRPHFLTTKKLNDMNKILALLLVFTSMLMSGQTSFTGIVIDANDNNPIPGVNIKVLGNNTGTSTDFDGNFKLNVSDEVPFSIEITSVGYQTQTIEITSDGQTLEIALVENATSLDEVVVSASRTP